MLQSLNQRFYVLRFFLTKKLYFDFEITQGYIFQKTSIPNNCASPLEIEDMNNNLSSGFRLKFSTSQYIKIQENYKNVYINFQGGQFVYSILKAQKQITKVQKGPFFQDSNQYSSPIYYQQVNYIYDQQSFKNKTGQTNLVQASIQMDDIIQYFSKQYHSFPEVQASCNSALALLMLKGVFAKYFTSQLIKQDFFLLCLQNMYSANFEKILKLNGLLEKNEFTNAQTKESQQQIKEQQEKLEELENMQSVIVPCFQSAFIDQFKQKSEKQVRIQKQKNKPVPSQRVFIRNIKAYQIFSNPSSVKRKNKFNSIKVKDILFNSNNQSTVGLDKYQHFQNSNNQSSQEINQFYKDQQHIQQLNIEKDSKYHIQHQLYQDIILLKKAIMILFTEEQLASLKLVGFTHTGFDFNCQNSQDQ
ncbi:hypothetical protein ABPG72_003330 [Tetrahymena utriculariae]